MSTKTNTDKVLKLQQESLNTTDKQVSTFKPLEGTPFTLVSDDGKVYGVMGKYRLTEGFESEEHTLQNYLDDNFDNLEMLSDLCSFRGNETNLFEYATKIYNELKNV